MVSIEAPDFSYCLKKKGILINIFDSCMKYASSKEKAERSAKLSLTNQILKDEELINYALDSEEEFEDKFG